MSPTIYREDGYRFFFFSREEERMHVHIISGDGEAKFWLEPDLMLATSHGFNRRQLKKVEAIVEERQNEFISAWRKYFSS